jgi:flagellar basal-body rod protein FlgB
MTRQDLPIAGRAPGMAGISLLTALTEKMRWHQQRQDLLAENVANADTPGYRGRELKPVSFGDTLGDLALDPVTSIADPLFFPLQGMGEDPARARAQASFEVTPEGNGVTLEDEMMKVTANQMDYQAVTTLYTKSLGLIRTALGRA